MVRGCTGKRGDNQEEEEAKHKHTGGELSAACAQIRPPFVRKFPLVMTVLSRGVKLKVWCLEISKLDFPTGNIFTIIKFEKSPSMRNI